MDLSKKFAFYFGATALVAVAVTIVCQMALTSVGGAILIALLVAPIYNADGNERIALTHHRGRTAPSAVWASARTPRDWI